MSARGEHRALHRLDDFHVAVENPQGVPVTLIAGRDVPVGPEAVDELLSFLTVQDALAALGEGFWGGPPGLIHRVVLTPDFHRGAGIPVGTVAETEGFVLPRSVGNDVGCGMRLLALDVRADEVRAKIGELPASFRSIFFAGRRDIPMSPRQREAVLREGLPGLAATASDNAGVGAWAYYDARRERFDRIHRGGSLPTRDIFAFADYVRGSGRNDGRDAQVGSIGGGNHFVEVQEVEDVLDGPTAELFGLRRGATVVMVHSGSVGLGHAVGGYFNDLAKQLHPVGVAHGGGFYALPTRGPHEAVSAAYLSALGCAANFAFANRLLLGLMAVRAIDEVLARSIEWSTVFDAPHNLVWPSTDGAWLHRKGACPARGPAPEDDGPFRYTGDPVLVPGSMGAPSYVLAGAGCDAALASACHGAGRSLARGAAKVAAEAFDEEMARLVVVTPVDADAPAVRLRRDIVQSLRDRLMEEAPHAYKDVGPVVRSVEGAGIARRVAKLAPILTVKG